MSLPERSLLAETSSSSSSDLNASDEAAIELPLTDCDQDSIFSGLGDDGRDLDISRSRSRLRL